MVYKKLLIMSLSKSQDNFLSAVMIGENVWLKGKAGTGKSYITRLALSRLKSPEGLRIIQPVKN